MHPKTRDNKKSVWTSYLKAPSLVTHKRERTEKKITEIFEPANERAPGLGECAWGGVDAGRLLLHAV